MWSIGPGLTRAIVTMCAYLRAAAFVLLALSCAYVASPCDAQGEPAKERSVSLSEIRLVDAILIDKDGQSIDFAKEAIGDRIVVINFIYTSCRTLCPFASATFKLVQDRLGPRLGKYVRLITLTLDPLSDMPQRLHEFADQFEPGPDWLWLTGTAVDIESVLQGLGVNAANFKEHAPLTLIGDARYGRWTQLNVLPNPAQIDAEVTRMLRAR